MLHLLDIVAGPLKKPLKQDWRDMKKQPPADAAAVLDPSATLAKMKKSADPAQYTVVKRNGTLVPFRRDRIVKALEAAFRDTKKMAKGSPFEAELVKTVEQIADLVVKQVLALASRGACLTVEGIQDVVEVTLMKNGHHDVARDYILYRDERKAERESSLLHLRIYRRDKTTTARFNPMKIASSIEHAFREARNLEEHSPDDVLAAVSLLTQKIVADMSDLAAKDQALHIEMIEDSIERELMSEKIFDVAKYYILYRAEKEKKREAALPHPVDDIALARQFHVMTQNGQTTITDADVRSDIAFACRGLEDRVSVYQLLEATVLQFYEGMKDHELDLAKIFAAKSKIEAEPAYSKVASRLLLDSIYRETIGRKASDTALVKAHREFFKKTVKEAIALERLSPALLDFDLDEISKAIDLKRDDLFTYLGLQTLYDRYFIHHEQRRLETPQIFWMRVAMGLALKEGDQKNKRAIEFYDVLSQFYFTSSTPTLFNSGTLHSQLSSCYLSTVIDDLSHIFKVISDDAQLSKWAGGIGNDWSNVRATGARIKGTNGTSQGVIPFLKVANDTAVAVNQCFAPDTLIHTSKGIMPISKVQQKDLVLGISGIYREVRQVFAYDQKKEPMVSIQPKHAFGPIHVTEGHPFYAIQGVPLEQSNERTLNSLKKGKIRCTWVEAGALCRGDYIAQVIPKEIVQVPSFTEEDARLYGILLGDGHLSKNGMQWGVSGNPQKDEHLSFVKRYLEKRGIHFWETGRGENYLQIHWSSGCGVVRDGTTGRITEAGAPTLPFEQSDLYDTQGRKQIAPRLSHLPPNQTLALVQGLLETDGNISRGKEITFTNTSLPLVEGLRYQMLRLGVPTAGQFRVRKNSHTGKRSDGSLARFSGETACYDVRIPAIEELASRFGCKPLTKRNWLTVGNHLFTRIVKTQKAPSVPFVFDLKVEGDESYMTTSGLAHNGGKRKGAMCAYLETWHLDIEDFLELRKNTGDERRRTHDMNTANWIPDLFMKRVRENGSWTLFSPSDAPDLHDLYGKAFEERYIQYEKMTDEGKLKLFKRIEAVQLWRKMLSMLFETGHPWITFKDPSNIRSPQDHQGIVHSSNLCTEILLNTSAQETAVCNLGSVNLAQHVTEKGLDEKRIAATVRTAVRMLDNVIDINFYPTPEAKNANLRHRPIGLGLMGFQDALYIQNMSYASHEAVSFADKSMEMISYYAILASTELAKERGAYPTYKGSKWERGYLPIDTIGLLEEERGMKIDLDRSTSMDWDPVRKAVKEHGMRNSNTMAIAPTATIGNITGAIPSIEPIYKHLFVKSNLSGEFTITNEYLVERLKKLQVWDSEMIDDLKYFDGSIREIERIPDDVKSIFLTAFEIEPEWIIECAARRQKWIDMGQSLNLYLAEPSGKKLHQMYLLAWEKGLKTTYYLRSQSATQIEKSTMDINKRGLQPRWMKNKSASSNIKVERTDALPKACNLGEGCESCQ